MEYLLMKLVDTLFESQSKSKVLENFLDIMLYVPEFNGLFFKNKGNKLDNYSFSEPIKNKKHILLIVDEGVYWKKMEMDYLFNSFFNQCENKIIYIIFTGSCSNLNTQMLNYSRKVVLYNSADIFRMLDDFPRNNTSLTVNEIATYFKNSYITKFGNPSSIDIADLVDACISQVVDTPLNLNKWLELSKIAKSNNQKLKFLLSTNKKTMNYKCYIEMSTTQNHLQLIDSIIESEVDKENYEVAALFYNIKCQGNIDKEIVFCYTIHSTNESHLVLWQSNSQNFNGLFEYFTNSKNDIS